VKLENFSQTFLIVYSNKTMGRLDSSSSGGRLKSKKIDLSTRKGLEKLAEKISKKTDLKVPEEKRPFSGLRKIGGILNADVATIAGGVRGAIRPDISVLEGAREGLKNRETFGFADIIREDLGINPTTRAGKIGVGTAGFVADVLFSPLTYLTFGLGRGLKVGGQTLNKVGTKLAQRAGREATEAGAKRLLVGKTTEETAKLLAARRATPVVNDLLQRTFGKKGITEAGARQFMKEGVNEGTLNTLRQLGPQIIDKGGVKMFGKTLVKSSTLAKTRIGKLAAKLGETEIAQALKSTLGKTFVSDFNKDKRLINIINKASRGQKRAMEGIIESNEKLFNGLSDDQMSDFFDVIFKKKKEISEAGKEETARKALLDVDETIIPKKGEGTVTPKKIENASQLLRREAKVAQRKETLTIDDFGGDQKLLDVSNQLFEGKDAIVSKFAKAAGISEEDAIKFYIPSKFNDKIKVKDFSVGRNLSSSDFGFRKKFTGVENKNLIRDPFEAFSRGQIDVVTSRIKDRGFRSAINAVGSKVEKEGWKKISRKDIAGGKIDGWFPDEVADEINKFLEPKLKSIDELARVTGFDWATGIFKGYVTSLFPGFHFRNMTSNQFQNMLKIGLDVGNVKIQKAAIDVVRSKNLNKVIVAKNGKRFTIKEIRKLVEKESDILDASGPFGKIEQFLDESQQRIQRKGGLTKLNPLSRNNIALEMGRKVGTATEAQAKMTSVIQALMEGKSVKQGIKQAEDALFNYGKLTDVEKSIMRRLIPFYTFGRKNLELQAKALATTPGKIASQLKFFRGASNAIGEPVTDEDLENLPSWVLEGLGIKAGVDDHGRNLFISGFGLPIEEFLSRFSGENGIVWNTVQNLMTQSNPIIKFPAERATGVDFFRDKPITELSNAQNLKPFFDIMPEKVSKEFKDLIQFREIPNGKSIIVNGKKVGKESKFTADPFALHFIRNLPTSRFVSTVGFIGDPEEAPMNKALRFFTGVKGWSIDAERQRFFNDLERKKELTDWLVRMGGVGVFERPYEK